MIHTLVILPHFLDEIRKEFVELVHLAVPYDLWKFVLDVNPTTRHRVHDSHWLEIPIDSGIVYQ